MASIYDVDTNQLLINVAEQLKTNGTITPPEWAQFCKTGMSKERAPSNQDWWYVRSASVLRKVMMLGPVGVAKLRVQYGGKKNRGNKPERFYPGSGSVARKILQQLEKAGYITQLEKSTRKGRVITPQGQKLVDTEAQKLFVQQPRLQLEGEAVQKAPEQPKPETKLQQEQSKHTPHPVVKENKNTDAKENVVMEKPKKEAEQKPEVKKEDNSPKKEETKNQEQTGEQ